MNSIKAFENKVRVARYATPFDARKELMNHPLVAEYVFDMLQSRGVLTVAEDGSVSGVARKETAMGDWKPTWPARDTLLGIIAREPAGFTGIKDTLKGLGEANGHWVLIAALKHLSDSGLIQKQGKVFTRVMSVEKVREELTTGLADAEQKKWEADVRADLAKWGDGDFAALDDAFEAMPPPRTEAKVNAWIEKNRPGACGGKLNQRFIDWAATKNIAGLATPGIDSDEY